MADASSCSRRSGNYATSSATIPTSSCWRSRRDGRSKDERLCRRPADVLGAGSFRTVGDVEFDAVPLTQIVDALAVDGALVEEIFLASSAFDKPEALFCTQCLNRSGHVVSDIPTRVASPSSRLPALNRRRSPAESTVGHICNTRRTCRGCRASPTG